MLATVTRHYRPLLLGVLVCFPTLAHDGPEQEIEEITEQIRIQGYSTDLLLRRAIEYQILGKLAEAAKDLEHALELDRTSANAQRELSETYFALGKTNEALATITRALQDRDRSEEQASLFMTRAAILRARRDYTKALSDATHAIEQYPLNAEWYLTRSQLQALLNQKQERVKGLDDGLRLTGSGVLLGEWLDALIENGQAPQALVTVEQQLQKSRWKSAWLIRRAKARLALGQTEVGRADLTSAIDELSRRLSVSSEALLLSERALAHELLGQRAEARRDYRAARDLGMSDEWIRERIRALRESPKDEE